MWCGPTQPTYHHHSSLVVDLLLVDLIQDDLLDDPGRLHFDSSTESISKSFTEFDNSPWISGFANRLRYHVRRQVRVNTRSLQARLSLKLPCVLSSVVIGRLRGGYVGPPTAFLRGWPAWTHRCAPESRMTLRQRANPCWYGCWCAWSRDVLRSVRSRFTCVEGCENNWWYLVCN